jgi:hypothetical protein
MRQVNVWSARGPEWWTVTKRSCSIVSQGCCRCREPDSIRFRRVAQGGAQGVEDVDNETEVPRE